MPSGHDALKLAPDVLGYLNFSSGCAGPPVSRQPEYPLWPGGGGNRRRKARLAGPRRAAPPVAPRPPRPQRRLPANRPGRGRPGAGLRSPLGGLSPVPPRPACSTRPTRPSLGPSSSAARWRRSCSKAARGTRPSGSSPDAISQLNDYLGHRPVAVLRTQQKIQPYAHEWVRPIPLWIRGAGVAEGPYHDLVQRALAILEATDPMLLLEAMFDPALLGRIGRRSPRLRLRPPGQQAAQLPLRAVGPGQAGQFGPLPPLHRAADLPGRHAPARGRPRRAALRGGALRGSRRAGGDDVDGLGRSAAIGRTPTIRASPWSAWCSRSPCTATPSTSGCWRG